MGTSLSFPLFFSENIYSPSRASSSSSNSNHQRVWPSKRLQASCNHRSIACLYICMSFPSCWFSRSCDAVTRHTHPPLKHRRPWALIWFQPFLSPHSFKDSQKNLISFAKEYLSVFWPFFFRYFLIFFRNIFSLVIVVFNPSDLSASGLRSFVFQWNNDENWKMKQMTDDNKKYFQIWLRCSTNQWPSGG